jgi:hypothetical protein
MKDQPKITMDGFPFWQCPRCRVKIYPPEGQRNHDRWHERRDKLMNKFDWHGKPRVEGKKNDA